MKNFYQYLLTGLCTFLCMCAWAQAPHNTGTYYQKAHGKKGAELKTAMYEIINTPAVLEYDSLWTAYQISDAHTPRGVIWDMYSFKSAYPSYPVDKTIHANGKLWVDPEGTRGFQREHSMPKSWFNPVAKSGTSYTYKDIWPQYSDLMHIVPAEGIVNNKRSNWPYGETNVTVNDTVKPNKNNYYISEEGFSKLGACVYEPSDPNIPKYTGKCFEPNDQYKGDFARTYFYMVTAYEKKQPTWSSTGPGIGDHCGTWTGSMFNLEDDDPYQPFAPWALDMLMKWAKQDPVSQKEIDRNEAVYKMQGNRNPFIDYADPNGGGLEDYIWGDKKEEAFDYGGDLPTEEPTSDNCDIALNKTTFGVDWTISEERKAELIAAEKDWTLYDNLRDYYDRIPVTIEKNGITISFSFGICGRQLYADESELRLYNYNTLTFKAHNNKITKVEFTLGGSNHADKKLKAFVGTLDGNTWTGEEDEVLFTTEYVASKYNTGTKTTTNFYQALSNAVITVANPTGIQQIEQERYTDDHVYNLWGVRMDERQLKPGIYIKNGRKFIVR